MGVNTTRWVKMQLKFLEIGSEKGKYNQMGDSTTGWSLGLYLRCKESLGLQLTCKQSFGRYLRCTESFRRSLRCKESLGQENGKTLGILRKTVTYNIQNHREMGQT